MNEAADKEDVKALAEKLNKLGDSVERMRAQNSAEHGSLFTKLLHVSTLAGWLKEAWIRFTILPPPPPDKRSKDDTQ